jgi:ATP-dependent exoDNAse (exonuclease V) beta subunit
MKDTLFSSAYREEWMKGYLDNLNLMYVAFTRAQDILFLGVPESRNRTLKHAGDLLNAILEGKAEKEPSLHPLEQYREGNRIRLGKAPSRRAEPTDEEGWKISSYPVNQRDSLLKVRSRSDDYFVDEDGIFRTDQLYGNTMHKVFSGIHAPEDIDPLLLSFQKEGLITQSDRDELTIRIKKMISKPGIYEWFEERPDRVVHNEREMLCGDGKVVRPDRVVVDGGEVTVIDFKFGKEERKHHVNQVENYMRYLKLAGYERIRGFIWYVILDKTIEVNEV